MICSWAAQDRAGPGGGEGRDTHRGPHTHTGTYAQMLHLFISDLPLKRCPSFHHAENVGERLRGNTIMGQQA